jgi:hypothetical protein
MLARPSDQARELAALLTQLGGDPGSADMARQLAAQVVEGVMARAAGRLGVDPNVLFPGLQAAVAARADGGGAPQLPAPA